MYFWHNGILTPDLEKTMEFLSTAAGTPDYKWNIKEAEFHQSKMVSGDGGKLRTAFGRIGGIVIELIQPLDDASYHAQTLKRRGPGFHHNAYVCEDNMDETLAGLYAIGGHPVWEFRDETTHACYVESADGLVILEIINHCPFVPE